MVFQLDMRRIQWPPPGSFEANILRTIEVPYQATNVSGRRCPPARPLDAAAVPGFKIVWKQGSVLRLPATEKGP
jgi:hypothetical protein